MKKVFIWLLLALYKYSGLRAIVSALESFVFRYSLRVRMVPVSFKVFLFALGVVSGYSYFLATDLYLVERNVIYPSPANITIENPLKIETVEAKGNRSIDDLADYIWFKESTRGKNNYSKCEEEKKVNGIGYAIPGDGSYICFESHEDEMVTLKGWLISKRASGLSDLQMLCLYSGSNYKEC